MGLDTLGMPSHQHKNRTISNAHAHRSDSRCIGLTQMVGTISSTGRLMMMVGIIILLSRPPSAVNGFATITATKSSSSSSPTRDPSRGISCSKSLSKWSTICRAMISNEEPGTTGAQLAPLAAMEDLTKERGDTIIAATEGNQPGKDDEPTATTAAIGTVNQRLLAELEAARDLEQNGPRSTVIPIPKAVTTIFGANRKTDEERRAAIAEARDLNGVNPVTALLGSTVALAGCVAFWQLTDTLAEYFALHPDDPNQFYVVSRIAVVVRNVAIGLSALASGFFGVTGLGILMLGLRVAYGVVTGELDPTPKVQKNESTTATGKDNAIEIVEMWKLMTNQSKKRGQR
jgi:hypothetical protein